MDLWTAWTARACVRTRFGVTVTDTDTHRIGRVYVTDMRTRLDCPICGQTSTPTARQPATRCAIRTRARGRQWQLSDGPICHQCAASAKQDTAASADGRVVASTSGCRVSSGRCEACGLQVSVRRDSRRKRHVCGDACRLRLYRTLARPTATACAECGNEFHARAGARYCSPACRQQAYRNRTKV